MFKKPFSNIQNDITQHNCIDGHKDLSKSTKIKPYLNKKIRELIQSPNQLMEFSSNLLLCSICYQSQKSQQKVIKKPCKCQVMVHKSCLESSMSGALKEAQMQQEKYKCNRCYKYFEVEIKISYNFDFQKACLLKGPVIYHYIACFLIMMGQIGLIVYLSKLFGKNQLQQSTRYNEINETNNAKSSLNGQQNYSQSNQLISIKEIETIVVIMIILLSIVLLILIFNLFKNHLIMIRKNISFINLKEGSKIKSDSTQVSQSQKKKVEQKGIQT